MFERRRSLVSVVSLAGLLLIAPRLTPTARAGEESKCTPRVTASGSIGAAADTPYQKIHDGDESTSLATLKKGWQYVTLDFACPVAVHELKRYMSSGGSTLGSRESGEGILYSLDGVRWRDLTADTTSGWEDAKFAPRDTGPDDPDGAPRYRGARWTGLSYGWSPGLRMWSPIYARFIRFNWEGVGDSIHEVDVDFEPAPSSLVGMPWDWARWDWTEDDLLELGYDGDVRNPSQPVERPWNENDGECYQENSDVEPEDGWVLLAVNLGSDPLRLPEYPYFFLYNKYRGLIRSYFFYGARYGSEPDATHQMGSLLVENGHVPAFTHHTATTLVDYNPDYEQVFMKKHMRLNHWACLDFDVAGYDPDVADPSKTASSFMLRFYKLQQSILEAQGVINLSGVLDAADLLTGRDTRSGLWDTIENASTQFLRATALFEDTRAAVDKLQQLASSRTTSATWLNEIHGAAAALSSGDVFSFVETLGGFISSVFTGGSDIPLSWYVDLTGELQISGTISIAPDLAGVRFYVPGTVYGPESELNPLYHQPLGVYALNYKPRVYWYVRESGVSRAANLDVDSSWVTINPHAGLQLISAKAALVSRQNLSQPLRELDHYVLDPNVVMSQTELSSLKVGLLLELQRVGQPLAAPVVIYKEFEPDKIYDGIEPVSGGR